MKRIQNHNPQPPILLEEEPVIAKTAVIKNVDFGPFTEVGDQCSIMVSSIDAYSYVMDRSSVIYSLIGRFVNVASDVRINPGNHPMEWVSSTISCTGEGDTDLPRPMIQPSSTGGAGSRFA